MLQPIPISQARQLPDEEILQRVKGGQRDFFEILMRRHNQTVYRAIRSILRDEAETEDAMQQTYLSAYLNLAQFGGGARFSTWLVRIAINEALDRKRKQLRLVQVEEAPVGEPPPQTPDPSASPEDQAAARELGRWLAHAIDELPDLYRTTVMLREVEGMATLEVAEVLGVTEDVIKTRLHRARALLRLQMETDVQATSREQFVFLAPRCDRVVAAVMSALLAD
jgi:RNA polymerase sigma-70 factor (ECF subfamily)